MKTVLIPTDFSERSLQLIKNAVLNYPDESITIVLASGYKMSISSAILSGYSKSILTALLVTKSFEKTLSSLIEDHRNKILDVTVDLYVGNTTDHFNTFLLSHDIDECLIPNNPLNQFARKRCYDLSSLIQDVSQNITTVTYKAGKQRQPNRFWIFNFKKLFSLY